MSNYKVIIRRLLYLALIFSSYLLFTIVILDFSHFNQQLNRVLFILISLIFFSGVLIIARAKFRKYQRINEKLDSELNKAIFEIMALFEFTNVLSSVLRLSQMMELIVDTIKRIHCYDGCCLFFYESEQYFSTQVNRGFPNKINEAQFPFQDLVGDSLIRLGQALIINNIDEEFSDFTTKHPDYKEYFGDFSSFALLPLMADKKFIGLLLLAKHGTSAYVQDDLRLLLIISNQAGLAIQNRRLYEQVYYSAITDGLTGIYNNKYFREQLELQLEKAQEYGFKISLLMIDIDRFKKFNDSYGHQIGDMVLKEVSLLIQNCVNPDSLVARYGGEEFVVILPDTPEDAAFIIGEKIRKNIANHIFKTSEYPNLKVTVSGGIATFPDHIINMDRMVVELIDIADDNLYSAKNAGRNRVCAPGLSLKKTENEKNIKKKSPTNT
ncbi:MAG: sensor domain-containing diguanylate cyclase [Firmicutes bacterium]|nr:sensor domain-containing diguanylate cyclase [Bacillota bacterium]